MIELYDHRRTIKTLMEVFKHPINRGGVADLGHGPYANEKVKELAFHTAAHGIHYGVTAGINRAYRTVYGSSNKARGAGVRPMTLLKHVLNGDYTLDDPNVPHRYDAIVGVNLSLVDNFTSSAPASMDFAIADCQITAEGRPYVRDTFELFHIMANNCMPLFYPLELAIITVDRISHVPSFVSPDPVTKDIGHAIYMAQRRIDDGASYVATVFVDDGSVHGYIIMEQ